MTTALRDVAAILPRDSTVTLSLQLFISGAARSQAMMRRAAAMLPATSRVRSPLVPPRAAT